MITTAIPRGAIRIPVPDTVQQTDWTCGAASVRAICGYFGCGPSTERQYKLDMSIPRAGADPEHLMWGFLRYGLDFRAYYPMTVEQLESSVRRGRPVLLMLRPGVKTSEQASTEGVTHGYGRTVTGWSRSA